MSQVQQTEPTLEVLAPLESGVEAVQGRTPWQLFYTRFKRDRIALFAAGVVLLLIALALLAPAFARFVVHRGPNDLNQGYTSDISVPLLGPSKIAWFGVDALGRDIFIRTLYGARTSLLIAILATGISIVVGIALGLMAGFVGGKLDTFISRLIDIVLSLPLLLLAIGIGAARIVRGQTLSLREREFVEAARATGYGNIHIMFREILPNMVASIIVVATLLIPQNILFEAALSFLAVGVPAGTPSWGGMLSDATNGALYRIAWWMLFFPGMFLVMTTLAFNLLGDGLRDALDPRAGR
ncbi:MAG: ABC transporter permease [Actinobacteria bacterium]|nr:MAG: ABC transporter permease [Actinomycetota bacterium]